MAKLSLDFASGTLHPREAQYATGALAALNAALSVSADGGNSLSFVITGTYVGTIAAEGTIDGTNWDVIPVKPVNAGGAYVLVLASAAVGRWTGPVGPFRQVRLRMSAFTSGSATVTLIAETGLSDITALLKSADLAVTNTGAAAAAVTLTIPAGGAGLFHYIDRIIVQRFATALLTAAATPVLVTTTNLPGTRVLSFPAEAAAQGTIYAETIDSSLPLRSSAANTATTIVCPATTGVIWRVTADYYLAP